MTGVETCDRCGFDRSQWNEQDATRTLDHADEFFERWTQDPRPKLVAKLDARRVDDQKAIAASADLYDQVHHLAHGLISIADIRRAADDAVERQVGAVAQVSTSSGGVPKSAVERADVGVRGLAGDIQKARAHHGRPWQALCLWSQEVIDAFAADGHPIGAGSCGENLTLSGIDWSALRGGTVIDIGPQVRLQLSLPAVPCSKNAQFFTEGDYTLMDHDLHPGTSRWYASVVRTGSVAVGDAVTISPT
ncbi:MAG: MOSC domain-containing protein [Ilumatobacter sp.]